jgi:hypothetical protein
MSALCEIGEDALYVIVAFCEIEFFFLGFTELPFHILCFYCFLLSFLATMGWISLDLGLMSSYVD